MGHPNNYHGTISEIRFMQALGPRGRFSRLQMLQHYRNACARRAAWGEIDRRALIQATDSEIAAEITKTGRKAA